MGFNSYSVADVLLSEILFTYDADGNRTSKTTSAGTAAYSYAPGFQLTSAGSDTFSHDANGRIDSMTRGGNTTALTYSSTDHVTSVTTGASTSSYSYDAAGRRTSVIDSSGSKSYLVAPSIGDGLDSPHLVLDGTTGAPIANYVYGGEHAFMRISGTTAEYYLEDAMGSVIGIANGSGALSQSIDYDSFGNVLNGATLPSDTAGEFRFHGMWLEPTGLYHVRARHYDASTGRFVSRDPVEGSALAPESWQPYLFAKNSGNVFRDPTGLFSLGETSAAQAVQSMIRKVVKDTVKDGVKDKLLGQVFGAVSNAIISKVGSGLPVFQQGANKNARKAGNAFEDFVGDKICELLGESGGSASNYFWREAGINQGNGKPFGGTKCQQAGPQDPATQDGFKQGNRRYAGNENAGRRNSFPDFLVSPVEPDKVQNGSALRKSWLWIEMKRNVNNVKVNGNQLRSMLLSIKEGTQHQRPLFTCRSLGRNIRLCVASERRPLSTKLVLRYSRC